MPWKEWDTMDLRGEFVQLAIQPDANIRALCRRFGISPKTGYKWLKRHRTLGEAGLQDQSRRPHASPARTPPPVEATIVALRQAHPAWGGRKLWKVLSEQGVAVPSPSGITHLLHRHGLITAEATRAHAPFQRFEREAPNQLWQMDFKGHFALTRGDGAIR